MRASPMILAIAASIALAACSSTPEPTTPPAATSASGAGVGAGGANAGAYGVAGQPAPGSAEEFNVTVGDRVYFGFDRFDLDNNARETLQRQASWLNINANATLVVEGHADERGTREYNLALGARRATAVKNYLVALGVPPARISTISYGKERPEATCSDESCWSRNRRGVSVVGGVPQI